MKQKPYEMYLSIAGLDRSFKALLNRAIAGHSIGLMEWLLLSYVKDGPADGRNMSSIARALGVTLPQVTTLTNRLLKSRLIEQKTQEADRRTRHVLLLPAGKELINAAGVSVDRYVQERLLKVPHIHQTDLDEFFRTANLVSGVNSAKAAYKDE